MTIFPSMLLLMGLVGSLSAGKTTVNPISSAVAMIAKLQQDVIQQGADEQKIYSEFSEMCEHRSKELHQEINAAKAQSIELSASIEKASADIAVLQEKISTTAGYSSDTESDLKKSVALRAKEADAFEVEDTKLSQVISMIGRTVSVIEREGPGASSAQTESRQSVTGLLESMVDASLVDSYDAAKLTALIQSSSSTDSDDDMDAPSAAAYKGQGGSVVNTLEGLLEKSQGQLDESRQAEVQSKNAYELVRQSLQDKLKTFAAEMGSAKKSLAAAMEGQASADGDLATNKKDMASDVKDLGDLHHECLSKANSFNDSGSERDEEMKALAEAKQTIIEFTAGATKRTYDLAQTASTSFLQVDSTQTLITDALHVVRRLAMDTRSKAMIDLSSRMSTAIQRSAASGTDVFVKVKSMIQSMIAQLLDEGNAAAEHKQYCDKAMGETQNNKDSKQSAVEKLSTQIDVMVSDSKRLEGKVATTYKELADSARTQAEMNEIRSEDKASYSKNKPLMDQGLEGVKTALKVLRDYYVQGDQTSSGGGAGASIIAMLEVVESDFSKGLADMVAAEQSAQAEYQANTNDNTVARAVKTKDAEHKTAQRATLGKSISEAQGDRDGVTDELSAVVEYLASLEKECVASPDPYEERRKRRTKEMAGLKNAMAVLAGETMLLQRSTSRKTLRGAATRDIAL